MNTAMILSECINESKLQKKPLFVAALDVQKAFDFVDHDSLLWKLYLDGISGDDWLFMKDLYSNVTAKVKWDVFLSSAVTIRQGVRQGQFCQPHPQYKRYNNSSLIDVEDRLCGKRIVTVSISHVTVADDMCFITEDEPDVQPMMSAAELQANRGHYTIHPTKTVILNYNDQRHPSVSLGTTVAAEDQTVHLGVHSHTKCAPNTDEKINLGYRTAYSLLAKKRTRQQYRSAIRTESAKRKVETKNKIIEANSSDKKLVHKLIKKQRQKGNSLIASH